jgi:hypothetical protein
VARALTARGIGYFLGGSLASSLQGEPRSTNDIDFVVDLPEGQIDALASELGPDFEVDTEALRDAVRRAGSWNVYYLPSLLKIDLFILRHASFDESEFARRRPLEIGPGQTLIVKSPEDSILRKLLWYRSGGESSASQWRDVVEILRVSGPALDAGYLANWAGALQVSDLLARAQSEAATATR